MRIRQAGGVAAVAVLLLLVALPASAAAPSRAGTAVLPMARVPLALVQLPDTFDEPVHVTHAGDGSGRLFVVEKPGVIRIVQNGRRLAHPFLDITGRVKSTCNECGLLSVAFPPDYATEGYFFVYYNAKDDVAPPDPGDVYGDDKVACQTDCNDTVIARFRVTTDDPNRADPESEERILVRNQPFPNHNGGQIAFGPDGFLYIGLGDGGSGGDPLNSGQRTDTILGKLLRIKVSSTGTYTIPATNPFKDDPGYRGEIWALGFRNPWRFAFDRLTGDLWIGDVGQGDYEEIDFQPAASAGRENYGWHVVEGNTCYQADDCDQSEFVAPVAVYTHAEGCSVTGGTVYRGPYRGLRGIYFFADYCSGKIWGLRQGSAAGDMTEVLDTDMYITSFGEDEAGNVYVAARDGRIARLFVYEISLPILTF